MVPIPLSSNLDTVTPLIRSMQRSPNKKHNRRRAFVSMCSQEMKLMHPEVREFTSRQVFIFVVRRIKRNGTRSCYFPAITLPRYIHVSQVVSLLSYILDERLALEVHRVPYEIPKRGGRACTGMKYTVQFVRSQLHPP